LIGRFLRTSVALLACVVAAPQCFADVFRPAYLEIREVDDERYDVLLEVPAQDDGRRLAIEVRFPDGTVDVEPRVSELEAGKHIARWRIERAGGLIGQRIEITGRAVGVTDMLARIERRDGTSQVASLPVGRASFVVEPPLGITDVAATYFVLGVEHILAGVDHLLFVLSLLLIVRGFNRVALTVTAFTVAHSLTLVAATFGVVNVPGPPVEAVIALSIVFVAAEAVRWRGGAPSLTARVPWVVAFGFGLLHGLGFAGALAEIGLPQQAIPLALLAFNVGVELGQLLFVVAILAIRATCEQLRFRQPAWMPALPAYAIGTVGMFWVAERIASF
jgi:hydrogenase/urease accessory protein HupE